MTSLDGRTESRRALPTALAAVRAAATLAAQTPARVSFDAASVRPNDGTTPGLASSCNRADGST